MKTVIRGGTVLTMNETRDVLERDVVFEDGVITALLEPGTPVDGVNRLVDAAGAVVMPGLVQAHVHLCQTLFRGLAEDVALLDWLERYIWPLEAAHTERSLELSARLGIGELLLSGATAALDMGTVHHTDVLFEVARDTGFRLTSGKAMMDTGDTVPAGLFETTADSMREAERLARAHHDTEGGRLNYAFAPRFILSCTPELMRQTATLARELGCRLHTHAAENPGEMEAVRAVTGLGNIDALGDLGFLGDDVILAHCVWVTEEERARLKKTGTHIAHCPSTNLKLASGIAPIATYVAEAMNVGIGADGAPCNNRMDALSEVRLAALLQKPSAGPAAFSAMDALYAATMGGAKLLGQADRIGSIELGKAADVIVVGMDGLHTAPIAPAPTRVVYGADARDVQHVFVDGRWLVKNGALVGVDTEALVRRVNRAAVSVAEAAGV